MHSMKLTAQVPSRKARKLSMQGKKMPCERRRSGRRKIESYIVHNKSNLKKITSKESTSEETYDECIDAVLARSCQHEDLFVCIKDTGSHWEFPHVTTMPPIERHLIDRPERSESALVETVWWREDANQRVQILLAFTLRTSIIAHCTCQHLYVCSHGVEEPRSHWESVHGTFCMRNFLLEVARLADRSESASGR